MGAAALNMLVDLINKKELKKKNVLIDPELIIRESCP
ncbi:MAG: substrate-binding domain-containing protein [Actinobacteria bacterium]|nr:substrate-binding domain-containing protein [Actinomycetota bacterium]